MVWNRVEELRFNIQPVPPTLVHTDYWMGNVLWDGQRIAAVIDWEEASYSVRRFDVGCCRMDMFLSKMGKVAADEFLAVYEAEIGWGGLRRIWRFENWPLRPARCTVRSDWPRWIRNCASSLQISKENQVTRNLDQQRMQKYCQLSSQIAQNDNAQLSSLLDNSDPLTRWGRNQTLEIEGNNVFVKRIPMTDIEQENMFSTKNLYNLPPYYNYGVGSVGSGIFRELVAHIKTTNWVLSGEIESFPLLYHYRVIPFSGERAEIDMEKHNEYVTYWGRSENIGRYMLDRANNATMELLLFLEYIPEVLASQLLEHPGQVDQRLLTCAQLSTSYSRRASSTSSPTFGMCLRMANVCI